MPKRHVVELSCFSKFHSFSFLAQSITPRQYLIPGHILTARITKYLSNHIKGGKSPIFQRIVKNFSISFTGSLGLMILSLIRTAILTKTLSIDDYGRVLIVINLVGFLINFLGLRVEDLMFRFYPVFQEANDHGGLRGLFIVGIILSASIGLLVSFGLFISAPWVSESIYQDPDLATPFRVYSVTALFIASEGFSTSILRLKDRFASVVLPKVSGAFVAVIGYTIYFYFMNEYSITIIVLITSLEFAIQSVFPLIQALRSISSHLALKNYPVNQALRKYRRTMLMLIFNTNIYGYLHKLTGPPGDVFLLGVFASPAQVAIYNIGQQIVRVAIVLQNNIQTALTPEIVSLWAKGKAHQLYKLLIRFSKVSFAVGSVGVVIGFLLAKPVVLLISSSEYVDGVFVLYVLIIKVYITFSTLPFYSMTLSMDMLNRRNIVLFGQFLLTVLAIAFTLTAFSMAFIQLLGTIFIFVICDLFVLIRLREICRNNQLAEV